MARKRKTTYMGGEWDGPEKVTPKMYEHFLNRKWLFGTLAMLVAFSLAMAWVVAWA